MVTQLKTSDGNTYHSDNISPLARLDIPGGGQVTIEENYAYIGYMYGPEGTSIIDISNPKEPKVVWTTKLDNPQAHSHKVRVLGDYMVTNCEQRPRAGIKMTKEFDDHGVKIWDIKDKTRPKLINYHKTGGRGVHRFDMDDDYLYLSTEMEGYLGHILVIYDWRNPEKLEEVSRWWIPGQHTAGGEEPGPLKREHRLHHALRHGDHLFAGLWMSGFAIIATPEALPLGADIEQHNTYHHLTPEEAAEVKEMAHCHTNQHASLPTQDGHATQQVEHHGRSDPS